MSVENILSEWAAANPMSQKANGHSIRYLVDGVTQDVRFEPPFPVSIVDSGGATVRTADGDELICYVMGHGSLLLGHQPAPVIEAVQRQADIAFHFGGSHPLEAEWASRILELFPNASKARFTSSGTEATMLACRLARAKTGRERMVKLNGHFNGWHDSVLRGFSVPFDRTFAGVSTAAFAQTSAIEPDLTLLEKLLKNGDTAGLIVEPAGGYSGAVPVRADFIAGARDLCSRYGTLLIFDEVVTGFRWSPGGAQALLGIEPDITTLGKIVAGGLPGGVAIGTDQVMGVLSDSRGPEKVIHTGTHNAHPLAAAAGLATIDLIRDGKVQSRAAATCESLIAGFNRVLSHYGVAGIAYGASSHFCMIVGVPEVAGTEDATELSSSTLRKGTPPEVLAALNCAMMLNGVHLFHGHGFVSAAHDEETTGRTIEAFDRSIDRLQTEGVV